MVSNVGGLGGFAGAGAGAGACFPLRFGLFTYTISSSELLLSDDGRDQVSKRTSGRRSLWRRRCWRCAGESGPYHCARDRHDARSEYGEIETTMDEDALDQIAAWVRNAAGVER